MAGKKTADVRFTVNEKAAKYLRWLVENSTLGKTENEVAEHILLERLSQMSGESLQP